MSIGNLFTEFDGKKAQRLNYKFQNILKTVFIVFVKKV